ncbi:CD8+ T cell target antigen Tp2, putative [Babesia ovis]|uniref:CD8+ T cell target antigen Tp2, putative n=1 Tax=Babesia ovis TaxID=5869 RepID=A0A0H4T1T5_BABOV|nr:surface protein D [Babesia ovis]GFE55284.1 CD8+ T cell target antigen Tp2, putative [Babesia ovis]
MLAKYLAFVTFFFSVLSAGVRAEGQCNDADLMAVGFHPNESEDQMLPKLKVTTKALKKLMTSNMTKVSEGDQTMLINKLTASLQKGGITGVQPQCLKCFVASAQCVLKKCKVQCLSDEYCDGCQNCIRKHCDASFASCVGQATVNPAEFKAKLTA